MVVVLTCRFGTWLGLSVLFLTFPGLDLSPFALGSTHVFLLGGGNGMAIIRWCTELVLGDCKTVRLKVNVIL